MRTNKDITVVIPFSGDFNYLTLCLAGLQDQIRKPAEIIIVCDNVELDEHPLEDSLIETNIPYTIHVYHSPNGQKGNRSAVRNAGIRLVSTDFIHLLDEDVVLHHTYFLEMEKRLSKFDDFSFINVHGSIKNYKKIGVTERTKLLLEVKESFRPRPTEQSATSSVTDSYWMSFCTGAMLVPRDLIIKAGLFDENITGWGEEDSEMGFRMYKAGAKFYSYPNLKGAHLARPGIEQRVRNRGWRKNLEYTFKKHASEPEYLKARARCLEFVRRYS